MSTYYYPQLSTGALSQFPVRKTIGQRTIVNQTPGDSVIKMADPDSSFRRWEFQYVGLADVELAKLRDLFIACEGRLKSFQMIDPLANLLRWSESLDNDVWLTSMAVAGEVADPDGRSRAWRVTNGAQAAQTISQQVDVPGWYRHTFSVWVRSESARSVELTLSTADGEIEVAVPVTGQWERIQLSCEIAGEEVGVQCSIAIPGATAVEVCGPQLEAQPDASGYRKTTEVTGMTTARFDQDEFTCTSYGPNNHSVVLQIVTVQE